MISNYHARVPMGTECQPHLGTSSAEACSGGLSPVPGLSLTPPSLPPSLPSSLPPFLAAVPCPPLPCACTRVADEFTFDDLDDVAFRPLHESNCGPPLTHFDRPFERQSGPPAAAQSGTHSSGRKRTKLVAAAVGREGPRGNIDFERLWSEGEQRTSLKALAATHAAYNDKHWLRRLWCILHTDDPFVATMLPWSPCGTALGVNRSLPAALGGGKYLKASNMKSFQRQLTEYGFRTANDKPLDPAAASACSTWYSAPELSIHQTYEEFKEMCERRRRLNNLKKAAEPVPPKARGKP